MKHSTLKRATALFMSLPIGTTVAKMAIVILLGLAAFSGTAYARPQISTSNGFWNGPLDLNPPSPIGSSMVWNGSKWEIHVCWHEITRTLVGPTSNCGIYDWSTPCGTVNANGYQSVLLKAANYPVNVSITSSSGQPVPPPWTVAWDGWLVDANGTQWPLVNDLPVNQYYVLALSDNEGTASMTLLRTSSGWNLTYSWSNPRPISSVPLIQTVTVTPSGGNWIITITTDDKLANIAWKTGATCLPANNGLKTVTVPANTAYKVYVMNEYGSVYRVINADGTSGATNYGCPGC